MSQTPHFFHIWVSLLFPTVYVSLRFWLQLYMNTPRTVNHVYWHIYLLKQTDQWRYYAAGLCKKTVFINSRTLNTILGYFFFVFCSFHWVRHSRIVFLCLRANVSVQTNLSLCRAKCHTHATKGENMIHIVFREREHNVAKKKTNVFFFFLSVFPPHYNFDRITDT